jgi:hypothetical protein
MCATVRDGPHDLWLLRYLEEHKGLTIDDAVFIAAALVALRGEAREEATTLLRRAAGSDELLPSRSAEAR